MKKTSKKTFIPGYINAELSPELVLEVFAAGGKAKSFGLPELLSIFGAGRYKKRELEGILGALVGEGRLVRFKGPSYALAQGLKSVRGHIKIQRQGMGFIRPQGGGEEVYVHQSQLNGAWDGDLVLAGILPVRGGKSREGRVLEVLERRLRELMVELLPQAVKEDGVIKRLGRPLDTRLPGYLLVNLEGLEPRPGPGEMVLAEPESGRNADGVTRAKALSAFGAAESLGMYERLVKSEHNISTSFPEPVLKEAAALPPDPDPKAELAARPEQPPRRDLRGTGFVTIDGADARDFDDAVCVEKTGAGYTLWVAIADVAHYVRPGGEIDREALKRGNSCYFPASVEPMLPEALSNGLCSLRPGVPRLGVAAEISLNARGEVQKAEFFRALVQSRARLTYEEAQAIIDGRGNGGPQAAASQDPQPDPDVAAMLRRAAALAEAMLQRRAARGALNFELPEARAEVDARGKVVSLGLRQRLFSHRLIEEFMIAANEAVASRLAGYAGQGLSFLYRAHPAPDGDKLAELAKILGKIPAQSGSPNAAETLLPERPNAGDLQRLLESVRGTPREFVVGRLVLRSMMQAVYSPVPEGHFGLASEAYAHFTSPIRRYADLTVHRALLHTLGYPGKIPSHGALMQIADEINDCEREAVAAEREIYKICAALYLRGRIGEDFSGVVSGLSSFGLFVELADPPCDGFVRVESLPEDYYQLDQERQLLMGRRSGVRFSLGQPLALRLVRADALRREITFDLASAPGKGAAAKNASKPTPKPGRGAKGKKDKAPKGSVRRRT